MDHFFSSRILELMENLGFGDRKQAKFANAIGITPSYLSAIIKLKKGPSFGFIFGIVKSFPRVNISWLLTGEGQMLRGPEVALIDDELKIGEWDEDTGIVTPEGDPLRRHGQSARMGLEVQTPEQAETARRAREERASLYNDMENDPEAADLLTKTWQIIKSGSGYSASLAANIQYSHQSMMTENQLNGIVQDVGDMKNIVKDLVLECKEIKERLKKSDSSIRQEDPEEIRGEIFKKTGNIIYPKRFFKKG